MKRLYVFMISALVIISLLLTSCSGKQANPVNTDNKSGAAKTDSNISAKGVLPIVKDKATLRVFMAQSPLVKDYNENKFTKYLESKTNVHIQFDLASDKDFGQKLNLMLSSQSDLPDIIIGTASQSMQVTYGSQGIFLSLNDLIDKHCVEFKKLYGKVKGVPEMLTAPDGKIYSMPFINECFNCALSQRMFVNKTFLDTLGLKEPQTTDDFYNMLKAFKERDPNGNGKADEIPLIASTNGWRISVEGFLMSSFINDDSLNRFTLKNGKIDVAFDKPEWKDGLTYLRKLAAEGLLDPVSFTQDSKQLTQLVEKQDAIVVGAVPAGSHGGFSNPNGDRRKNYIVIPPLKGPKGVQTCASYYYNFVQSGRFVITKACKNPDIAMKWCDFLYNDEASLFARLGEPGTDWVKAAPGEIGVDGKPAFYKDILKWGSVQNSHWATNHPMYQQSIIASGMVADKNNPFENEYFLYNAALKYEKYAPEEVPPVFCTVDEEKEIAEIRTNINNYVKECMARFILGDMKVSAGTTTVMQIDLLFDIL